MHVTLFYILLHINFNFNDLKNVSVVALLQQ